MFEHMKYEKIMNRMLNRISPSNDKREGAIIFDALAPASIEMQLLYISLDTILKETFADTASRGNLIKRAKERGIAPYPATSALLKGVFAPAALEIPIGSRFNHAELNYIVLEKISDGEYKIQCETSGGVGNKYFGDLIPIEYMAGLATAKLTELLIPGEDEEDTEVFRQRYFDSLESQAFGGNVADYKNKVNALPGVGGVKVYPVWNGGGTVKLVIINSEHGVPAAELITQVQTAIDPTQNQGKGMGLAPIGHVVTVAGCAESTVNIETKITFQAGWAWNSTEPYIQKAIDDYFKELAKEWANNDSLIVRISQVETRLLDLAGILDIADTKLNGVAQNLQLTSDNIPKRGSVTNV